MSHYYRRGRLGCGTVLLLILLAYTACRYWILQGEFFRMTGRHP